MRSTLLVFGIALPWLIVALFVALGSAGRQAHSGGVQAAAQWSGVRGPAPGFRLPLLHHPCSSRVPGELSLAEYRGREVLLVFSDPNCGRCDQLAPPFEQLSRRTSGIQVLMVSRGDLEANRAKAAQHGLTFPVVRQRQWEISRKYGTFPLQSRISSTRQGSQLTRQRWASSRSWCCSPARQPSPTGYNPGLPQSDPPPWVGPHRNPRRPVSSGSDQDFNPVTIRTRRRSSPLPCGPSRRPSEIGRRGARSRGNNRGRTSA